MRTDRQPCTSPAAEIGWELDAAITLFRKAMPGFGLKLLVSPPLPDGSTGPISVSAWRRGEQSAPVLCAVHASDAVRQLFDCERRARLERRRRTACKLCRGTGWYIAWNGMRVICAHHSDHDSGADGG